MIDPFRAGRAEIGEEKPPPEGGGVSWPDVALGLTPGLRLGLGFGPAFGPVFFRPRRARKSRFLGFSGMLTQLGYLSFPNCVKQVCLARDMLCFSGRAAGYRQLRFVYL